MSRIFNYETNRIESLSDVENAEELIGSGRAVELSLPELDKYAREADELHDSFIRRRDNIKDSNNPLYTDEVKQYEIDKLEAEYREKSAEVEEQYTAYRKEQLEKTRVRAAQATIDITDADKLTASQFATRAALELASTSKKGDVLKRIENEVGLLTDGQRVALQSEMVGLLAGVDDNEQGKKSLIAAVQKVKNEDKLSYIIAQQLPHSVLTKQRIYDAATKVVRESAEARSNESIGRGFYEKHIKGVGK